ncbi:MAG: hypothetical protein FD165_2374 [Gammaproteobacteria bacterium]|nr:MAG: hypothetical protein FD165_2374 [Gammaproteobacteria bacterium]TND01963.1 MAG: hypothetical protein FD120_2491 [Gammaproteobacteria bacterium]
MNRRALICALLSGALLTACLDNSVDLPPERPASVIRGSAVDGIIVNGTVNVYVFNDGIKGERLGGGTTDGEGRYAIDVRAPDGPLLIEVAGGNYSEEATGTAVALQDGQLLRAVSLYRSGQPLTVTVTPLTNLAAGLAAYRISTGAGVGAAIASAVADVSQAFGVNVRDTTPRVITDPRNLTNALTDEYFYGFLLAGISSWTRLAGETNNVDPHTTYTSMSLAQLMYRDIRSDGALDGRGTGGDGQPINLAIGTVPLDADVYRVSFAQHMMSMAISAENRTGLSVADLRDRAVLLAKADSGVFGNEPSDPGAARPPVVNSIDPEGLYYSGVFTYEVIVQGAVVAVTFTLDGTAIGSAQDLSRPSIAVDSRNDADGAHRVGVTATDGLDNETHREFLINIDNTRPFVNVTSSLVTNNPNYLMSGSSTDNGAGISSILVNGVAASVAVDGTWLVAVVLQAGINPLTVVITDHAGNANEAAASVRLDVDGPVIDTAGRHGSARFVTGDDAFEEIRLGDRNDDRPLYLTSDRLDLGGIPITRRDLENNHIPFFGFRVTDPAASGAGVTVTMQYERNEKVVTPWRRLNTAEGENGYLVPVATEMLAATWHQTIPADRHTLRVKVTDLAGNTTEKLFTFRADIRVPDIAIDSMANTGQTFFDGYSFANRGNISGVTFDANTYTFTNNTGKAYYVTFNDDSSHQADQLVETMVREHSVRPVTSVEWRVRPINNVEPGLAQADNFSCPSPGDWEVIGEVRNYNGNAWETRTPPEGQPGDPFAVSSDAVPASEPDGDWADVADFDSQHDSVIRDGLFYELKYKRDYLVTNDRPALVRDWRVKQRGSPNVDCADLRNFQQRGIIRHESVDGPKNTSAELHEISGFGTTDYVVINKSVTNNNNPQGTPIDSFQGWFWIPAGHTILVRKRVTAPVLTLYNDTDVADPGTFSSYEPHKLDKTITWSVKPKLVITAVHDAGIERMFEMSPRKNAVAVGAAAAVYTISR